MRDLFHVLGDIRQPLHQVVGRYPLDHIGDLIAILQLGSPVGARRDRQVILPEQTRAHF